MNHSYRSWLYIFLLRYLINKHELPYTDYKWLCLFLYFSIIGINYITIRPLWGTVLSLCNLIVCSFAWQAEGTEQYLYLEYYACLFIWLTSRSYETLPVQWHFIFSCWISWRYSILIGRGTIPPDTTTLAQVELSVVCDGKYHFFLLYCT